MNKMSKSLVNRVRQLSHNSNHPKGEYEIGDRVFVTPKGQDMKGIEPFLGMVSKKIDYSQSGHLYKVIGGSRVYYATYGEMERA